MDAVHNSTSKSVPGLPGREELPGESRYQVLIDDLILDAECASANHNYLAVRNIAQELVIQAQLAVDEAGAHD